MIVRVCSTCFAEIPKGRNGPVDVCPICGGPSGDLGPRSAEEVQIEAGLIDELRDAFDSCPFRPEPAWTGGSSAPRAGGLLWAGSALELGGRRLGDFELLFEIGRGGMGVVYRARQLSLDRHVALKILPMHAGGSTSRARRFRTESHAVARLAHPNVVPIYANGDEEGLLYYAMELVDGTSLDSAIHTRPGLLTSRSVRDRSAGGVGDPENALDDAHESAAFQENDPPPSPRSGREYRHLANLMADVAEGLAHAHQQGVLHRDIKPQNLLLGRDGRLRISDFGLAQLIDEPNLTASWHIMGTPAYLSPEQVRGAAGTIDQRADVYALGATLYELLTARKPFQGETRDQILHQIIEREPEHPRSIDPTIPRDFETICLRAMSKDPADRFQSATALAEELRRFAEERPILSRRAGPIRRTNLWIWRHKAASIALVATATAVMLAVAFGWNVRSSRQSRAARLLDDVYQRLAYGDYRLSEAVSDDIAEATALGAPVEQLLFVEALAHLGAMENQAAVEGLETLIESGHDDRRALYLLAWARWRVGDRQGSRDALAAADERPHEPEADELFFRGLAVHFDDAGEAIASYRQAVEKRATNHEFYPQAVLHLARALNQEMYKSRRMDGLEEAGASLRELIRHGHYGAYPYYLLSITHRLAGEILSETDPAPTEAADRFADALHWAVEGQYVDAADDRPVTAEAECLEAMGRFADALGARTRALEVADRTRERCETFHYRWRLLYWLGRPLEALEDVEAHAACLPDNPYYAYVYPALLHAEMGEQEVALARALGVVEDEGAALRSALVSAVALRLIGQTAEADALILDPERVDPSAQANESDRLWVEMLYEYAAGSATWEDLVGLVEEGGAVRQRRAEAHFHAGIGALSAARREEARSHFRQAIHAADGALGYSYHARVVLGKMRVSPSWPTSHEPDSDVSDLSSFGADGIVQDAGDAVLVGDEHGE